MVILLQRSKAKAKPEQNPLHSPWKEPFHMWIGEEKAEYSKSFLKNNCPRRHVLAKQETLLEKGTGGREQQGKGNQENCSAMWLTV